jgi:hypothetical protein
MRIENRVGTRKIHFLKILTQNGICQQILAIGPTVSLHGNPFSDSRVTTRRERGGLTQQG